MKPKQKERIIGTGKSRKDHVIKTKDYKGYLFLGYNEKTHSVMSAIKSDELMHMLREINSTTPEFIDSLNMMLMQIRIFERK